MPHTPHTPHLFDTPTAPISDTLSDKEKLEWLRLARAENVGPITFYRLVEFYGSPGKALDHLPELAKRGGKKKPLIAPDIGVIAREYEDLRALGGDLLTAGEASYPAALRAIDDAPPVLSYLGNLDLAHSSCIGMVGARNASVNGRKLAETIARDLGTRQQTVVSGLARGIDTAAHKGSLSSGTIAVIAGGIDVIYPEENTGLYEQIREQGLILAESPFSQKPFAQSFPKRNRIISGLSKGVVVVEATMRSGSLITARMAGEQGRDVWAVPGSPMDPRAAGPNHLIREGASLVRSAEDIMEACLNFSGNALRDIHIVNEPYDIGFESPDTLPENAEVLLLENLSFTPLAVDELIRSCHLTVGAVQTVLLELELAGRIKRLPGNRVQLLGD